MPAMTNSRADLLEQIDRQVRNVVKFIVSGECEDFAAYRYTVGKLEGMEDVRDQFVQFFASEDDE